MQLGYLSFEGTKGSGEKEGKNASSEYVFEILRNACEMNSVFEMKLDKFGFLLFSFFFLKKKHINT